MTIKRALISVSDKDGIADFARELNKLNIEIISSGGTYQLLKENGISAKKVDEITGFPEILGGRVKTLHPKIHGGILARRDDDHLTQLDSHQIPQIDLLVVNLYPFEATVANASVTKAEAIEKIDVGGPTMIRAAAKNHDYVTVLVDKDDYSLVLDELKSSKEIGADTRAKLALKAFQHTASYDIAISNYLHRLNSDAMPDRALFSFTKQQDLRYGENPHQLAAFYRDPSAQSISIANSKQLWGK
ncbi:MAG: bifunctional phosphoribosylaminoimidazolecarboxamide formyltransferase/IMP cyclohydrolase, partial [Calditrichaeota bacterium]|nr:bifunctional phosphoribosylaminoimidazolecarboxamide formyltransferase/IMP cyclohydrolase [Calditrichota bacterium]